MNRLKSFAFRYPLVFSIGVMIPSVLLTEIHLENFLSNYVDFQNASYMTGIFEQGLVSLLLAMLIFGLGMQRESGFTPWREWKQVWLIWPLLIFSALNIDEGVLNGSNPIDLTHPERIVLLVLLFASVGFIEEILFRGLILPLMLKKWGSSRGGIYLSVLLSSSIFGLLHLINFFMGRYTLLSTLAQITFGTFFGVFFAACFLRTRSIWPVIFTHALFDLCGNLNEITLNSHFGKVQETTLQGALVVVAVTLPLLLYGLFILRKVEPNHVMDSGGNKGGVVHSEALLNS